MYIASNVEASVIQDDYEQGEIGKLIYIVDEKYVGKSQDSIINVLVKATQSLGFYTIMMEDPKSWTYDSENMIFSFNYPSDENGNEIILDKDNMNKWKAGLIKVYNFEIRIVVDEVIRVNESLANMNGFEII